MADNTVVYSRLQGPPRLHDILEGRVVTDVGGRDDDALDVLASHVAQYCDMEGEVVLGSVAQYCLMEGGSGVRECTMQYWRNMQYWLTQSCTSRWHVSLINARTQNSTYHYYIIE